MSTAQEHFISPQEYLERERKSDIRCGYFSGEMFELYRGTARDSLIKANLAGELVCGLKGESCIAYGSDLRIKVPETGLYTYPHASVVCGQCEFDDEYRDTILNPIFVAEVLSFGIEDRFGPGRGWNSYSPLKAMQEYLMISPESPELILYSRSPGEGWTTTIAKGLDQQITVSSVGVSLALEELYHKVKFGAE